MEKELEDYIRKGFEKGFSKEKIRTHLVSKGHNAAAVDRAIKRTLKELRPHPYNRRLILLLIAGLVVLLIVSGAVFLVLTTKSEEKIDECQGVSISLMDFEGEPFICIMPDWRPMIILYNNGEMTIDYAKVTLRGEEGDAIMELPNLGLSPRGSFPVQNSTYNVVEKGKLNEITILPGIMKENLIICREYRMDFESTPPCP